MGDFQTSMHEADEKVSAYIAGICQQLAALGTNIAGETDKTYVMSLAISIATQTFLQMGGNPDAGENIGEAVKQGVITTLQAYKQMGRITQRPQRGRLN